MDISNTKFIVEDNKLFAVMDKRKVIVVKCEEDKVSHTYTITTCPFCGGTHKHGNEFGLRCSHCNSVDKQQSYIIANTEEYSLCLDLAKYI